MAQDQNAAKVDDLLPHSNFEFGPVKIRFLITKDKLKLFLEADVEKSDDLIHPLSKAELIALVPNLVVDTFHDNLFDEISRELSLGKAVTRRRVAKGKEAIPGRDGRLVLLVKPFPKKGEARETIDPWFVRQFDNIEEGTAVARIYEPKSGVEGINVFGEKIAPSFGKNVDIKTDGTLLISTDDGYKTLLARVTGYLLVENTSLRIVETLELSGDVDIDSGDIDFVGAVLVKGKVGKNFRIRARTSIEIKDDFIDGVLTAKFGSVKIAGHAQGHLGEELAVSKSASLAQLSRAWSDEGYSISAGGEVDLVVANNLAVEAKGEIRIVKESRLCNLRSQNAIFISKGNLYGGIATTVCGLEALIIGNHQGLRTFIELKSDVESSGDYVLLTAKIEKFKAAVETLKLTLGPYADNPTRLVLLKAEHREKMEELMRKLRIAAKELTKLEKERAELLTRSRTTLMHRVNILGRAYPGVVIAAEDSLYKVETELKGPITIEYSREKKEFSVGELRPVVCEF